MIRIVISIIAIVCAIAIIIRSAFTDSNQELRANAILGWITILIMDLIALLH